MQFSVLTPVCSLQVRRHSAFADACVSLSSAGTISSPSGPCILTPSFVTSPQLPARLPISTSSNSMQQLPPGSSISHPATQQVAPHASSSWSDMHQTSEAVQAHKVRSQPDTAERLWDGSGSGFNAGGSGGGGNGGPREEGEGRGPRKEFFALVGAGMTSTSPGECSALTCVL